MSAIASCWKELGTEDGRRGRPDSWRNQRKGNGQSHTRGRERESVNERRQKPERRTASVSWAGRLVSGSALHVCAPASSSLIHPRGAASGSSSVPVCVNNIRSCIPWSDPRPVLYTKTSHTPTAKTDRRVLKGNKLFTFSRELISVCVHAARLSCSKKERSQRGRLNRTERDDSSKFVFCARGYWRSVCLFWWGGARHRQLALILFIRQFALCCRSISECLDKKRKKLKKKRGTLSCYFSLAMSLRTASGDVMQMATAERVKTILAGAAAHWHDDVDGQSAFHSIESSPPTLPSYFPPHLWLELTMSIDCRRRLIY